ncbi:desmethyl-deoxy-podophyllotoxin synthase [Aegilops tauschii subsp. strangulata]|uniref:Cytochrome P450 71D7 n=2 Tax=Aegilops tauschii subsp. strangulata TaxID=200361 RepID=A0A453A7K7_AEGTS|nr:desmethyl-deoxy-podophyllotoxin synthase isoform X1 [Aegilops tauschii subsp. strangulata]
MEVTISSISFVSLALVLLLWFFHPKPNKHLRPPGPWTLPIIGSLHHVFGVLPHRIMAELSRRHGPLMFLRLGEVPTVVVSSAEMAEVVMKSKDLMFASRPRGVTLDVIGYGSGIGIIFAPYSDRWHQARKVCTMELLSTKQVKRMEGIRSEEVSNLLSSITTSIGTTINLTEKLSALMNDVIARAVFGGKCAQQGEYLRELEKVTALVGGFSLVDLFPSSRLVRLLSSGERRMRRSYGRIQCIISNIIEQRKEMRAAVSSNDEEDLLDVLLRLHKEDSLPYPLTLEAIGVIIFDLFAGGTKTSGITLEWAMSELLKNPENMRKVQLEVRQVVGGQQSVINNNDLHDLHYMRMVIKEVLRLHPPAPLLPRRAREDCEIMGYKIPEGTNVQVNIFVICQDCRYWDAPEAFKPERFKESNIDHKGTHFEFTPFGAGRRQCPGMLFGTSTVEIALANLLHHFDWVFPDGPNPGSLDMSEKFGINVRRKFDLELRATPYVLSKVA